MTPQIFISYSRSDEQFARELRRQLQQMGYRAWMDVFDIPKGARWPDEIDKGLNGSDLVIGIITPESVESPNVKNEWDWALVNHKVLLLLRLRECVVPHHYVSINYIDFVVEDTAAAFEILRNTLYQQLGSTLQPATQAQFVVERAVQREDESAVFLQPARSHRLNVTPLWGTFSNGALWVSDQAQQIEVLPSASGVAASRRLLPDYPWKAVLPGLWRNGAVFSDWDGNLYLYELQTHGETVLRRARYDDLPVHLLRTSPAGDLVAAAWDGQVLRWDANGQPLAPVRTGQLITHLCAAQSGRLALVDQTGMLRLLDVNGREVWSWAVPDHVDELWFHDVENQPATVLLVLGGTRLAQIHEGETQPQVINLERRITAYSNVQEETGGWWTVIALATNEIEWVSWSPFRLAESYQTRLDEPVKQIIALHDIQNPSAAAAVGLTESGQIFTLHNRDVVVYPGAPISRLFIDAPGRLLAALRPGILEIYRNPALQTIKCDVTIAEIQGHLVVGEYRKLRVALTNTGQPPIQRLVAQLTDLNCIPPTKPSHLREPLLPGQTVSLDFSVKATESGTSVPLELYVELEDEIGPPSICLTLRFDVESRKP